MTDVLDITEQLHRMINTTTDGGTIVTGMKAAEEIQHLRAENEKLRAERDLWISRFEDFRKNAARLEEARSRPMRLVGSAAALKETGDES